MAAKILAFAGSTRTASFNKRLVRVAVEGARAAGAEVTLIDLRDFPMPIYDGDLEDEKGIPEHGMRLKALFLANDGLLLSCPEYNSSISGVWKNAIDWVSRSAPGEASLACFKDKTAAILSASPGALGGLRGLVHVRSILGNLGVLVLPQQLAVGHAGDAFQADGVLKDAKQQSTATAIGANLAKLVAKLRA
jgi:chromate reductase